MANPRCRPIVQGRHNRPGRLLFGQVRGGTVAQLPRRLGQRCHRPKRRRRQRLSPAERLHRLCPIRQPESGLRRPPPVRRRQVDQWRTVRLQRPIYQHTEPDKLSSEPGSGRRHTAGRWPQRCPATATDAAPSARRPEPIGSVHVGRLSGEPSWPGRHPDAGMPRQIECPTTARYRPANRV